MYGIFQVILSLTFPFQAPKYASRKAIVNDFQYLVSQPLPLLNLNWPKIKVASYFDDSL